MKNAILFTAFAATFLISSAQVRVCYNGHLQIGAPIPQSGSGDFPQTGLVKAQNAALNDSTAFIY